MELIFQYTYGQISVLTTDEKEVAYETTNLGPPTAIVNNATCVKSLMKSTWADTGGTIFLITTIHISYTVVTLERKNILSLKIYYLTNNILIETYIFLGLGGNHFSLSPVSAFLNLSSTDLLPSLVFNWLKNLSNVSLSRQVWKK